MLTLQEMTWHSLADGDWAGSFKAVGSAEREREAGAGAGAGSAYFQKSSGAKRFRERFLYNT
jgi:hypothetical protein